MAWVSAPRVNGKSVLQLESAGDVSWRKGQKLWRPLCRKLNLVVRRVAELQVQGSRVYIKTAAAEAAVAQRRERAMTMAAYVRHLEGAAKAKAKAAHGESGTGNEMGWEVMSERGLWLIGLQCAFA
jgi:hypothetical protein